MSFKKTLPIASVVLTVAFASTVNAKSPNFVKSGELQPHRAVYELKLHSGAKNEGVSSASGRWVFEMNGSNCSGYDMSYRFVSRIQFDDGSTRNIDASGTSFEDAESQVFNFTNQTRINGNLVEDAQGAVSKRKEELLVRLTKPERQQVKIPSHVIFPVEQYRQIIGAAKSGQRFLATDVYEGAEDGSIYSPTSALIGNKRAAGDDETESSSAVKDLATQNMQSWPVTMSYFEATDGATGESTPSWQSSFILYENGVTRNFVLDYGSFSLSGKLSELKYTKGESCN